MANWLDLGITFLLAGFLLLWNSDSLAVKFGASLNLNKHLFWYRFVAVSMMASGLFFLGLLVWKASL